MDRPPGPSPQLDSVAIAPDLFRSIVETISDYAIFALDRDGTILTWNRGAERLKGYTATEIIGHSFEVFYPKEAIETQFPKHELEVAARDGRFEDEGWRLRKDGSRFWAKVTITARRDEIGQLAGFAKVTADMTERKEADEALRRSEEQFRLLVQGVQEYAILTLDTEGRVVSWNEGARRIKGFTADEIIGRSFETFYPKEAVAAGFPRHELEVAAREGQFEDEGWRVRKDGSRFWATAVLTAIRDAHGALIGFGKVTRDLTARREAEQRNRELAAEQAAHAEAAKKNAELDELNKLLRQALADTERARAATEAAYRDLDQFAYVASHDLKAPLRGISSLAQWIQEDVADHLTGDSAQHMRLLQGRVRRLQSLIDGILTYSRAGRVLTKSERIDTGKLISEVIDLQVPNEIQIDLAPDMPTVEAERIPLQQVFMNLIGNAVKYASAARPDVQIAIGWRDQGSAVEFAVSDNGPGIPPQFHDRIWGVFQTLESRDKVEGAGIGLAVVKKIVETRGGQVSLESTEGEGSTFRFTWPKAPTGNVA
jgi:PAS domain S-box-containing protein